MSEVVTLETCAREPIHIPGSIQPHGVLFACRGPELIVTQVSENVERYLGAAPDAVLGQPLAALFAPASVAVISGAFADPERLREISPLRVASAAGADFEAALHVAAGGQLVVEIEPSDGGEQLLGFDPRMRASLIRLQRATSLAALHAVAAEEVRALTGFDRVMVYRFDRDWNGEVVAESRRDDLEPFFGLHYPASDIPEQARRLYTINYLRLIGDVDYTPQRVLPPLDPERRQPLDLSFSVLRSVSPIHVEYLKNMGVSASMSISLVVDGVLIGLVACHHYSGPRVITLHARDTAEHLARALAWNIAMLERAERAERARQCALRETALIRSISRTNDFLDGLVSPELLDLVAATGAAVVVQEGTRRLGDTPPAETIARLVAWLAQADRDVFASDHAARDIPIPLGDVAGVLAVAISPALREYIVWFRLSTERTVDWAGEPTKVVVKQEAGAPPRLSPRGSFALWRETVRGHSEPWDVIAVEAASNLRRTLLAGVRVRAAEISGYNERLLEADRAKDDFIATVSHELRTPLNAIAGWIQLLENGAPSPERLRQGLQVIARNTRAQAQIVDDLLDVSRMVSGKLSLDLASVDLHDLLVEVIDSLEVGMTAKGLRLRRVLDPEASLVLGDLTRLRQVIANLLNNAMKFTPKGGSVTISLRRVNSEVEISVSDSGQGIPPEFLPLVFDVFRQADSGMNRRSQGLGLGLAIARKLVELHGGRITAESAGAGQGATFRVWLPLAPIKLVATTPPEGVAAVSRALEGCDILVVEDEGDSRELLCHILAEAGATCTQLASADEALAELAVRPYTVMISDIGMPGQDGFQLMRTLRARPAAQGGRVPAVALTAYTRAADRSTALNVGYDAHLGKPVDANELLAVVASVVARSRR